MLVDLVYRGRLCVGNTVVQGTVLVDEGRIVGVHGPGYPAEGDLVLDYSGRSGAVMFPGFIDMHVHLRGLELSYKEDEATGTMAAAAGGVVMVVDMPNTRPQVRSVRVLEEKLRALEEKALVDYMVYVGVPEDAEEADDLAGHPRVAGFKVYPDDYGDEAKLRGVMEAAARHGKLVIVHAEHPGFFVEKPVPGYRWMNRGIQAEREAVKYMLKLAEGTGARLHFTHMTCRSGVLLARAGGATVDTCPHYLLLDASHEERLKCIAKVSPPLRTEDIVEGLVEALIDGLIDALASDHAPHSIEEKMMGFKDCPPGIPGIETLVPLTWTLVEYGVIMLRDMVRLLSEGPARILGLDGYGRIEEGYRASLTIIDTYTRRPVDPDGFKSKAKYSPFKGIELRGWPVATIVDGRLVFHEGEVLC